MNPVRGGSAVATARKLGATLPPLGRQRRDLPPETCDAIDRALLPRPGERGTIATAQPRVEKSAARARRRTGHRRRRRPFERAATAVTRIRGADPPWLAAPQPRAGAGRRRCGARCGRRAGRWRIAEAGDGERQTPIGRVAVTDVDARVETRVRAPGAGRTRAATAMAPHAHGPRAAGPGGRRTRRARARDVLGDGPPPVQAAPRRRARRRHRRPASAARLDRHRRSAARLGRRRRRRGRRASRS